MSRTLIIAKREYLQIARTRAFMITLVVIPLFMAAVFFVIGLIQPPVGDAYLVVDKGSGRYGAAVEQRIEASYQRYAAASFSRFAAARAPAPRPPLWFNPAQDLSDADVAAFVAAGGLEAAKAELAKTAPAQPGTFKAPDRRFLKADPASVKIDPETGRLPKEAQTRAGKRPLALVLEIPADFGPAHPAIIRSNGLPSDTLVGMIKTELTKTLRAEAVAQAGLDPAAIARLDAVQAPVTYEASKQSTRQSQVLNSVVPSAVGYLLMITVMITGMMLLQSVIEERSNKLLESLLACVKPQDLMQGKLLGICAVGLTVIVVWGGFAVGALSLAPPEVTQPIKAALASINTPRLLFLLPFYYLSGYLAFAMLFLAVGAVSDSMQDAQAYMTPLWILLMVPYIILPSSIATGGGGMIPKILSWIPLYTPFAMPFRMGNEVPGWEIIGTGVLLVIFIAIEWVLIGKLFRTSLLRTGQPKLGDLIKRLMVRQAA